MTKALTSELLAPRLQGVTLFEAAERAQEDEDWIPILGDLLIQENEVETYRRPAMMLCFGVPFDTKPPAHLGDRARDTWRTQRQQSMKKAEKHWEIYAGYRRDWALAVLATMIFGDWDPATSPTPTAYRGDGIPYPSTRSPWALIREHHLAQSRAPRAQRQATLRAYRAEQKAKVEARRIAKRSSANQGVEGKDGNG